MCGIRMRAQITGRTIEKRSRGESIKDIMSIWGVVGACGGPLYQGEVCISTGVSVSTGPVGASL